MMFGKKQLNFELKEIEKRREFIDIEKIEAEIVKRKIEINDSWKEFKLSVSNWVAEPKEDNDFECELKILRNYALKSEFLSWLSLNYWQINKSPEKKSEKVVKNLEEISFLIELFTSSFSINNENEITTIIENRQWGSYFSQNN